MAAGHRKNNEAKKINLLNSNACKFNILELKFMPTSDNVQIILADRTKTLYS